MALLLDASIWVAGTTPHHRFHAAADAVLRSGARFSALEFTLLEVANAIGVRYGDPRRARRVCELIVQRCDEPLVRVDPIVLAHALELAVEHGLTAYDAAYVAVAESNGWTLVSADHRDLVSKGLAVAPDAAV